MRPRAPRPRPEPALLVLAGPAGEPLPRPMAWPEYVTWCIQTGRIVGEPEPVAPVAARVVVFGGRGR